MENDNFLKDVSDQIDEMNEKELELYISLANGTINDPYNGLDMNGQIALTILKNKAMKRMDSLKRESLKV